MAPSRIPAVVELLGLVPAVMAVVICGWLLAIAAPKELRSEIAPGAIPASPAVPAATPAAGDNSAPPSPLPIVIVGVGSHNASRAHALLAAESEIRALVGESARQAAVVEASNSTEAQHLAAELSRDLGVDLRRAAGAAANYGRVNAPPYHVVILAD